MISRRQLAAKRLLDICGSAILLLVALPVMALAAATIKVFSRGPILFVQVRIGLAERPFRIYKFRTMHLNSHKHKFGSVTVANDPRLFPGARLLRKLKIDELPQLWNVLQGSMSLVGPRPTVAEDVQRMTPRQRGRYALKPGLTGLAQIRGGAALLWPERIEYDLWHIDNYSVWLDFKVLLQTAVLVITGRADTNPLTDDEWGTCESRTKAILQDTKRSLAA